MVTERGLPSENKFQLLHKTMLATPPDVKLLSPIWFPHLAHIQLYREWQRREHCTESLQAEMPSWWNCLLLPVSSPLLFSASIHSEGTETSFFSASSYWSSIHINNFSGRIMYTRTCSNVPHSKSN